MQMNGDGSNCGSTSVSTWGRCATVDQTSLYKKQRHVYLTPRLSVASVIPESNVTVAVLIMFAEYAHFC